MKRATLALLEKLERRAVDEHRRQLAEAGRRMEAVQEALAGLRAARPVEASIGWGMGQGAAPLAAFWAGSRAAEQELATHLRQLERQRQSVMDAMRQRLAEAQRYALLSQGEGRRTAREAARREQAAVDDAVLARRAAARTSGPA